MSFRVRPTLGRRGTALLVAGSLAASGFVSIGLNGCGRVAGPTTTGSGFDLLARSPDQVIDQIGVVTPDMDEQWGRLGPHGWQTYTNKTSEGKSVRYVWSKQAKAHLELPAGTRKDRTTDVMLWGPPCEDAAERTAVLRLNGVELKGGEIVLPTLPTTFSFETPAELWKIGSNQLEIEVDLPRPLGTGVVGVAVAKVDYDRPSLTTVDPTKRELILRPETAVVYDVEELAPMQLFFSGQASGKGELFLTCARVDPADGSVTSTEELAVIDFDGQSIERAVNLPPSRGQVLELEAGWNGAAGSSFSFSRLEIVEPEPVPRVPVIFISIDTLSARRLSIYGHSRETAPHLADFSRDAVVFEHCVTNAPWTLPSYMSVMTGLYPYAHRLKPPPKGGGKTNLFERWYVADNRWMLAEALRAAGYATAGFVDNDWIVDRHGFPQGFETYDHSAGGIDMREVDGGIRHTTKLAREWLGELGAQSPFFLFIHGFDVHAPYVPPPPFLNTFKGDALYDATQTAFAGGVANCFGIIPTYVAGGEVPVGTPIPPRLPTGPIETKYDEGILLVDDALDTFFSYLKEVGLYDRAVIIVHADHGETMDDTNYYFGHGVMDEEVLHVPLIVRLPGGAHAGTRVKQTVQSADIYPTVLDLAGFEGQREYLHGRSLVPLLEGGTLPDKPTYSEGGIMKQASVAYEGWKLIVQYPTKDIAREVVLTHPRVPASWYEENLPEFLETGMTDDLFKRTIARPDARQLERDIRDRFLEGAEFKLYYLPDDPNEDTNLHKKRLDMRRALFELLSVEAAKMEAARDNARSPSAPVQLDAKTLQQLADIGYVDTGSDEDKDDKPLEVDTGSNKHDPPDDDEGGGPERR